ncbi:MAG: YkgJ family cysteine cluster protein [Candidatus Helarchaeota archaeon]
MGFQCERCGRCCSDPSLYVMITHRDILRFEFFLPEIDLFSFIAFYQVPKKALSIEKRLMSPRIITNRGEVFLGLLKKENHCIFFENKKCQIYECRPQICRSFPYTFQIRKDQLYWGYSTKAKEYCPALKKESKINKIELEQLATEILNETKEFEQLIKIWNHLARMGVIEPTVELLIQFITGKIKLSVEKLEHVKKK